MRIVNHLRQEAESTAGQKIKKNLRQKRSRSQRLSSKA